MEKQYLDYNGLQDVAGHVNTRLKTVTTIPVSADNGAVRLYVGATTNTYTNGHIYQYDSTNTTWKDITNFSIIFTGTQAEWDNLSLVEKQAYDICNITDDNQSGAVGGGDMESSTYDPNSTVANAGGIVDYVEDKFSDIIAEKFDSTVTYAKDDYCMYNGLLYKFNKSHTGAWSSSDADETLVSEEFGTGGNSGVQIPAIVGTKFHYNGTAQAPVITGFDSTHCTVTGTTSATNIGQYTITITLGQGLSWTDGTSAAKTYTYEIIPIGVKYTPTDDVQTWLACAEIWDKTSYTTLADVLADSETLEALLANSNAVDYLVRSTTWATSVCANSTAMTDIGSNDYCANALLTDSTWRTAICNSTYFESVLNVKVPTLSSNTNVLYSGYTTQYDRQPYYAFDNNDNTIWAVDSTSNPQYIGYIFSSDVNVRLVKMLRATGAEIKVTLQCSDDGSSWINCGSVTYSDGSNIHDLVSDNTNNKKYWRLYLEASNSNFAHKMVQFYGRASSSTQLIDMPYQASSLSYLRDVVITDPKDGQGIYYNKTNGKWENGSPAYLVPWSTGTEEQITNMINGYYNGRITLADIKSVWSIGDEREIEISAIATSGTYNNISWSVGESHRAQSVKVQIIDFDHDTLETTVGEKTKALITVTLKDCLRDASVSDTNGSANTENGKLNTTQANSWRNSSRRAWCNSGFLQALPLYIQRLVKPVNKLTSAGNKSSTIQTDKDYTFLLSEIELFGDRLFSYAGEGTVYALYSNASSNRIKYPKWDTRSTTVTSQYWGRSPYTGANESSCFVNDTNTKDATYSDSNKGIAPSWCM